MLDQPTARTKPTGQAHLSRTTLLVFAFTCGISVANIYDAQPLLDSIGASLGIAPASVGLVVTLTQVGYAAGLLCLVPLGDLVDRRKLILAQTLASSLFLCVAGSAPGAAVYLAAMMGVGLLATVVQVVVAFTATLAAAGAGRLADRGWGQATTGAALALLTLSWWPIGLLPHSLVALALGVVLLDLAVQAVHVTNQSLIFADYPKAQSRLVGGYMIFYSIGSAVGAIASTTVYAAAGWTGVSWLGAAFSLAGLGVWALTRRLGSV